MLFLKNLRLCNYCNYIDHTFDFTKPDGTPYGFICLYGPNGVGKSSILEAISLLTSDQAGRPLSLVQNSLRKYVRSEDYDPSYQKLAGMQYNNSFITGSTKEITDMLIEGTYILDGKEYIVSLTQDGWIRNDFDNKDLWGEDNLHYRRRLAHFITSDSDLSMHTFQIHNSHAKEFEEIISTIMRYPTECIRPSAMSDNPSNKDFCTDFVIIKKKHRIHFKRMSAGERKICKSFSDLLNLIHSLEHPTKGEPKMTGWPRLLLLDNIEMHVYYDRHTTMVDCLKRVFSQQQIIGTTHSGTLIQRALAGENDKDNELWIDLEQIIG
jgi:predicted ATP-binding protein involved in virulence